MSVDRIVAIAAQTATMARILAAWLLVPDMRLGQLLVAALNDHALAGAVSLHGIADDALAKMVERYAAERAGKDGGT